MMTPEQKITVDDVYSKFQASEDQDAWDDLDTQLSYLEYLNDKEIMTEATALVIEHLCGIVRCSKEGCLNCYANKVVEAAGYIVEHLRGSDILLPKDRYILSYYLSMASLKMIVSDEIK